MYLHYSYKDLIASLELSEYFTSFRPDDQGGTLVCASHKEKITGRLYGNSFLIFFRGNKWYISTWGAEKIYRLDEDKEIVSLCRKCLSRAKVPLGSIPDDIIEHFNLVLLSDEEKRNCLGF